MSGVVKNVFPEDVIRERAALLSSYRLVSSVPSDDSRRELLAMAAIFFFEQHFTMDSERGNALFLTFIQVSSMCPIIVK